MNAWYFREAAVFFLVEHDGMSSTADSTANITGSMCR